MIKIAEWHEVGFENIGAVLTLDEIDGNLFIHHLSKEENELLIGRVSTPEESDDVLDVIETFELYLSSIDMDRIHAVFLNTKNLFILSFLMRKYCHLKIAIFYHPEFYMLDTSNHVPYIVDSPSSEWC
jgi:hypothetical protein